jgi:hypothetical protein
MQYGDDNGDHPITEPAQIISLEADLVQIAPRALVYMAAELAANQDNTLKHWTQAAPNSAKHSLAALSWTQRAAFFTVYHCIGFCYWGSPRWQIEDEGTIYDGAIAWLICLTRNPQFLQGEHLRKLDGETFTNATAGVDGVAMPMAAERLQLLQQLGEKLDHFTTLIANKATTSGAMAALDLAFYIGKHLPGFDDQLRYRGLTMPFLKRAQLLSNDLNLLFSEYNKPLVELNKLTAFADYKLPQLLREKGILIYDDLLARQIDEQTEIAAGSQAEIEIRANTIIAVERLRVELLRAQLHWDARQVDARLWLAAQNLDKAKTRPYHRCRTINY